MLNVELWLWVMKMAWFWTIAVGIRLGFICVFTCFMFPPFGQIYYSMEDEVIRIPTGILIGSAILGLMIFLI
jgi:membrane protein YdbS with pleckstrin-like domain